MSDTHEQLVREVIAVTGAAPPVLYESDSPVLSTDGATADFYFIGLIGGKDVGKSALANALAGVEIGVESNFGPGTENATAYCHATHSAAVQTMLEREVGAGQFRVVTHSNNSLARQVFLDLPDIDSHFQSHLDLTRKLLRHMLFPIWVQSVEKYADQRPQQLLAKVAAGNDPRNFLFVMSKVDQVVKREGESAATDLRDDFAARIARTLSLERPPRVFTTAIPFPALYDLNELRRHVAQQKSTELVASARLLAAAQRDRSLVAWLDQQHLPERATRVKALEDEAADVLNDRVVAPLVESALPRLTADPAGRAALVDETMALRVSRWPLVPLVHTLLSPALMVVRANSSSVVTGATSPESVVSAYCTVEGQPVARATQAAFALLRQAHPATSDLYDRAKLWETLPSDIAGAKLQANLASAVERLREAVRTEVAGKSGILAPFVRVLLTVGVALWFPIVQPLLTQVIGGVAFPTTSDWLKFLVPVFGAEYLLRSAAMLVLWFLTLYLWLRRDTQRRIERAFSRATSVERDARHPSLADVISDWAADLIEPIRARREMLDNLVDRAALVARPK